MDSWRVSVLGGAGSDEWEIKVKHDRGQEHFVKKLDAHQTVDKVVEAALSAARKAGASYADVRIVRRRAEEIARKAAAAFLTH